MAMATNCNELASKIDYQYSNSSVLTWENQWDYNEELSSDGSAKSESKLGDYSMKMKSVASTGFEKAKCAASVGAKKAKARSSAGVRWIKILYQKKTNRALECDQASELKYKIH